MRYSHGYALMDTVRPTLFVSHANEDQLLVESLGNFLTRLSLKQFQIWFSSDKRADGGLQPGDLWFQQVQARMASCEAILVVVTNRSVNRPWIYFESGYGSASSQKKLIVVTHGISSVSEISPPLSYWQMYRVDTLDGLTQFSTKLLDIYGVAFDPILFEAYSAKYFDQLTSLAASPEPLSLGRPKVADQGGVDVQSILSHIDRRIFELSGLFPARDEYMSYHVTIVDSFSKERHRFEVFKGMNLQEAMDGIWSKISDFVPPYTYLLTWVLRHERTGIRLIVREMAFAIDATDVFKPSAVWVVDQLDKPFEVSAARPEASISGDSLS